MLAPCPGFEPELSQREPRILPLDHQESLQTTSGINYEPVCPICIIQPFLIVERVIWTRIVNCLLEEVTRNTVSIVYLPEQIVGETIVSLLRSRMDTTKYVCHLLDKHDGTLWHIDWPATSPDLNLTENLWDYFGQQEKPQNKHSLSGLYTNIVQEWAKIYRNRRLWCNPYLSGFKLLLR